MASIDSSIPDVQRSVEFVRAEAPVQSAKREKAQSTPAAAAGDAIEPDRKEPARASLTPEALEKRLRSLVEDLKNTSLSYSVEEGTSKIVVKIVDNDTGKVIQVIPQKKFLDMVSTLEELVGSSIDQKA